MNKHSRTSKDLAAAQVFERLRTRQSDQLLQATFPVEKNDRFSARQLAEAAQEDIDCF